MLPSFHKVIPNPTLKDVGYQEHLDLINQFEKRNAKYIVMDSKMILENPSSELKRLCHYADIPFTDEMLSWESGARQRMAYGQNIGTKTYIVRQDFWNIVQKLKISLASYYLY